MENRAASEKARKEDNGAITLLPGVAPEAEVVRIIEFSAEMRPDQVMGLVAAMQTALSQIPADRRSRYNIPDDFIGTSIVGINSSNCLISSGSRFSTSFMLPSKTVFLFSNLSTTPMLRCGELVKLKNMDDSVRAWRSTGIKFS